MLSDERDLVRMSVRQNLAFGLKLRKLPKEEWKRRVEEIAKTLGLEELLDRKPSALSGGQRQRVAMGRAIVREPKAFLMIESASRQSWSRNAAAAGSCRAVYR